MNYRLESGLLSYIKPWAQNWEPRTKTLAALLVVVGVVSLNSSMLALLALLLVLMAACIIGIPVKFIVSRLLIISPFLILMAMPLIFGGGWPVEPHRFNFASLIILKAAISMAVMIIMLSTQPLQQFLDGLAGMKVPAVIITVLFLAYRYLFLFYGDIKGTQRALKSRLFQPGINRKALQVYGELSGGMLIKSIDRSDHLYQAMASRGFSGGLPMVSSRSITTADIFKSLTAVAPVALLVVVERWCIM